MTNIPNLNKVSTFNNPNIQKETHKAMYGPDGNSAGGATFMSAKALETLIKGSGVPLKGKPFQLFYFLIKDVFMGKDVKSEEKNINKFAKQLTTITAYFKEWESIKSQVFAASSGTDTSRAFRGAVGKLLNSIMNRLGLSFPTDGSDISIKMFEGAIGMLTNLSVAQLDKAFPVLGVNSRSILSSLDQFMAYFGADPETKIKPHDLSSFWNMANAGGQPIDGGGNMPNPTVVTPFLDALSEGSSTLSGISASNTSKLQYAQNEYNRLNAFVHNMLSAWLNIRKGMNLKMSQARN